MNKLLYLSDDEIQSQLAAKYDLLVQIGSETFQYAIIDSLRKEAKVLAVFERPAIETTEELIKAIEDLPESKRQFKFPFNKVKISVATFNYTFIPESLFLDTDLNDYGKFLNPDRSGELLANSISSVGIKNVMNIDSNFKTALEGIFQKPKLYNQTVPFIEGVQKALQQTTQAALFIDIQPEYFQIALFKDFKFEFHNTFEYDNPDEFNYFLLSVIQSLELILEETTVSLSGRIIKSDEIYQRIEKYFENIQFIDSGNLVQFHVQSEDVHPHTFYTLLSLDLCE